MSNAKKTPAKKKTAPKPETYTTDQVRVDRLLKRLAAKESQHAQEVVELEVRYMMQIDRLTDQCAALTERLAAHEADEG